MMLKRIEENSNLSSLHAEINQSVSFKGIAIRISGTNDATGVDLEDIGRINYYKNGRDIISADFDFLMAFCHIVGGNPKDNSTVSGALDFYIYIPRRLGDNNVERVEPDDNAHIKCAFGSNLASHVQSGGKVEVYLDVEEGVQKYDLVIRQYSESISASSVRPFAIDQPNINMVMLADRVSDVLTLASSNIDEVTLEIGGNSSDATIEALIDNTNCQFNLESDYSLACVPYYSNGDITSRLSDNVRMSVNTSGASETQILVISYNFDSDRLVATRRKQVALLNSIKASKAGKKQLDTVAIINALSGAK